MVSHEKRSILAEISANVITDLTGYPFVSSLGADWKISGNITSNDLLPDWNVSLYCRGAVETERENRDGLLSVESQEVNVYNWEKGASGIIVEGNDTIGFFIITVNPLEDILLKPHVTEVFPDTNNGRTAKPKIRVSASWIPSPGVDYGIVGKIGYINLMIIRNGTNRKVWIYLDDHLHCMYQSDINETGISKKYRIIPYFLMENDIPRQERYDLFRLAWVSRMLSKCLDRYPSL
jgi:hypothetical protein